MNDKEVAELRRRLKPEKNNIGKFWGCYVNVDKEIAATFCKSINLLPSDEQEKYMELFRKTISGSVGRTLTNAVFSTQQVVNSEEHKLLMKIRESKMTDEGCVRELFEKIAGSLSLGVNYLILLTSDVYDVPMKSKDGVFQNDGGDTQYTYMLCSVCPIKETKPVLRYDSAEREFMNQGSEMVVASPELGFLFPAFDDRATNLYGALYYSKSAEASYDEFVEQVLHTKPPMPSGVQKETFREVLTDALENECSIEVVQTVHSKLRDMVQVHKEAKISDPLEITRQEVGEVLEDCGVSQQKLASFNVKYDSAFGVDTALPPANLLDAKKLEFKTPNVIVKVAPDRQDLVETRVLGGVKYLMIKVEEGVELNGVSVSIEE